MSLQWLHTPFTQAHEPHVPSVHSTVWALSPPQGLSTKGVLSFWIQITPHTLLHSLWQSYSHRIPTVTMSRNIKYHSQSKLPTPHKSVGDPFQQLGMTLWWAVGREAAWPPFTELGGCPAPASSPGQTQCQRRLKSSASDKITRGMQATVASFLLLWEDCVSHLTVADAASVLLTAVSLYTVLAAPLSVLFCKLCTENFSPTLHWLLVLICSHLIFLYLLMAKISIFSLLSHLGSPPTTFHTHFFQSTLIVL